MEEFDGRAQWRDSIEELDGGIQWKDSMEEFNGGTLLIIWNMEGLYRDHIEHRMISIVDIGTHYTDGT